MYRILVIEDDEIVSAIYETKIKAEGYEVETALDGETGYEKIKSFRPDLLLLDMNLPGLSGADLLVLVRGQEQFARMPVIAFTASDAPEVFAEARELGANKVLSKGDYTPDQIVARITASLAALPKREEADPEVLHNLADWIEPLWSEQTERERVLVVEDDPIMMELVKDIVEEEGYTVVKAEDGREAFKVLNKDANFVAAIFDVKMPYIEGPDLIRHMQTEKRLMKIPVLVVTSDESLKVQSESLSAGARLFLPKPFTRVTMKTMFRALTAKQTA